MRYQHLKQEERNEIAILLKKGYSLREIAYALKRSPSSVSREIKGNSVNGKYDPRKARHKAYVKRKYSKYQGMKIRENPMIENYIEEKLKLSWSPESIAGRMKSDLGVSVHHTVIYKYLYGRYGQHLCKYLRYRRHKKRKRMKTKSVREIIKNRVFIEKRPTLINDRIRYGDFEGDTLGVPKYTRQTLAGIIERKSRFILARKVSRLKNTMEGFKKMFQSLPALSLTLDNGVENVRHAELEIPTYFCHPYSSWEKGSIENAFGLIREFIPKRSSLKNYSQSDIDAILELINGRPRKILGWKTPTEVFQEQFLNNECCT